MFQEIIKTKIQNLIITDTLVSNENTIVIDAEILDLLDLIENDIVHIFNTENGYAKDVAIERAPRFSGIVCLYRNAYDKDFIKAGESITLLVYEYVPTRLIGNYKMKSIDYQDKN